MTIDQLEADLRAAFAQHASAVPDDVGDRVRNRNYHPRRRRPGTVTGIAAAVALATAGSAYLVSSAGSSPSPASTASPHAASRLQLTAAVKAAVSDASHDVFHIHDAADAGYQSDDWLSADGNTLHIKITGPSGSTTLDEVYTTTGATQTLKAVDYASQAWSTTSYPTPAVPANCDRPQCLDAANGGMPPGPGIGKTPLSAAGIAWILNSGEFTRMAGTQVIDGKSTFEITTNKMGPDYSMWIDQDTNLPVRVTIVQGSTPYYQSDISWLPPTAANLALLDVNVPDGFTQSATPVGQ